MRIGHGYDIHRFEDVPTKASVVLSGVAIPFERGIVAHSDGDVVLHAVCDALLGALALGDIGEHFPDTSPEYKDCDSRTLLKAVVGMVDSKGYRVHNVDVTILAEVPKINPHKLQMRTQLASLLDLAIDSVNVKATTHEGLDSIGQAKGIAVHAVVLVQPK